MQFKPVGNRIQLVAYRGYDQEKRRAIVKVLGSMDAYTLELPKDLLDILSEDEKAEVESFIADTKAKNKKQSDTFSVQYIASNLDRVADLVLDGVEDYGLSEQWGGEVWSALEKMQKALKKKGYTRPKREAKPKKTEDTQAELKLG